MTEQKQKQESPLQTPAESRPAPKPQIYPGFAPLATAIHGHTEALNRIADEVGKLNKTVHDGFTALGGVPYPPESEYDEPR